jgi:predicted nucleotidyltransferase
MYGWAMFSAEERDRVRGRLLELAESDPGVTGAAVTGSAATGDGDRWSDIDLALAVSGPLEPALERWTERLYRDVGAVHHWDLPSGSAVYRVFLLPGWLEVDLAFAPEAEFGPRGPSWRLVFGEAAPPEPVAPPSADHLAGLAWHHALHALVCIGRGRSWQAEHWISALRDQVLALACRRLGHPTAYAKGAHLLPARLTGPLEHALVRSLEEAELRRALGAAVTALAAELERSDPALAARLRPLLAELAVARR